MRRHIQTLNKYNTTRTYHYQYPKYKKNPIHLYPYPYQNHPHYLQNLHHLPKMMSSLYILNNELLITPHLYNDVQQTIIPIKTLTINIHTINIFITPFSLLQRRERRARLLIYCCCCATMYIIHNINWGCNNRPPSFTFHFCINITLVLYGSQK